MMDGFAIPHAKDHSIEEANVIIVQLNSKIDWKSLDGEGTDFIIALFIPDSEAGTTHLKLLSQVARLLMHKEVTNCLKQAQSPDEIAEIFKWKTGRKLKKGSSESMTLSNKQAYIQQLCNENGIISALAIDQRGALKKMIGRFQDHSVTTEQISAFKKSCQPS